MGKSNHKKNQGKKQGNKNDSNKNFKEMEKRVAEQDKISVETELIAKAIVEAYETIENNKRKHKADLEKMALQEWKESTGQKDYPENEKWLKKRWHIVTNNFAEVWHFLFFKAKDAKDLKTTLGLMKLAVSAMFGVCKWIVYIISAAMLAAPFVNGADVVSSVLFAIAVWVIARAFRIAVFEIDNNRDANLLISIFSGCLSLVAVVVAIVAIFV